MDGHKISELASIGPSDIPRKRYPKGVCSCCGVYYPPELRGAHDLEKAGRKSDPYGPEFIALLRDIGGLK